ncbi:MAG: GNAT family N-acetyltransferase [Deltaproteobacteria bacterium]|nr:GNAT family N-acetyltransferase [Deltaproteobacteria bacterium]
MGIDSKVRLARADELAKLIDLYRHLNPEDEYADLGRFEAIWKKIQADGDICYFVIEDDGRFAASCWLSIIPNLTRGGRSIGFVENVITHPDCRRKGYAAAVLKEAVETSRRRGCYKVILQSGRKRTEGHKLYEKLGFNKESKYGYELRL